MTKNITGIYKISSKIKDLFYIGSSVKCIKTRLRYHLRDLRSNKHHSSKLQNHFNKYGEESLNFEVLEFVHIDNVLIREQYYIDTLKPFFNSCPTAGNCKGRKFSNETKFKMSVVAKKRGINDALKAQQKSPYPKETDTEKYCSKHCCFHTKDMFNKQGGNICKEWFNSNRPSRSIPGTRQIAIRKLSKPIVAKNEEGYLEFKSLRECIRELSIKYPKINRTNINASIKNNKSYYGYTWSYKCQ